MTPELIYAAFVLLAGGVILLIVIAYQVGRILEAFDKFLSEGDE